MSNVRHERRSHSAMRHGHFRWMADLRGLAIVLRLSALVEHSDGTTQSPKRRISPFCTLRTMEASALATTSLRSAVLLTVCLHPLTAFGFSRGERKIEKIGRFRAKPAEPRVRIHFPPPLSLGCRDSPTKSIKLARLRALRAAEVHRRRAELWLSRRMGRILSLAQ